MKKLITLFLFFTFISVVSAGTSIPIQPTKAKSIILDFRSSNYVPKYQECQSETDIVRSIGNLYYKDISNQLTEWANEIKRTRPLTIDEADEYTQIKMIFLSEYSRPSNRTFALCDEMMDTFNQNK
ncbi:MAG: hypothetical protein HHAS10_07470 [Candidatus Altimarinota bacterium]